ncbi:MAG: hypothetical protein CMJ48_14245 [Planctomycetaceae bacterium]|nr:hypothetical protein [Planctomycetaceae bacterium]
MPIDFQFEAEYPLGSRIRDDALGRDVVRLCPIVTKGETRAAPFILTVLLAIAYFFAREFDVMPAFWLLLVFWGAMVATVVATAIRRRMTGTTLVEIDDAPLVRGARTGIRIYQEGDYPINRLRAAVNCQRHRSNEPNAPIASSLYSLDFVDAEGLQASRCEPIWEGTLDVPLEAGLPTCDGKDRWITWGLSLEIEPRGKPTISETYTIEVVAPT